MRSMVGEEEACPGLPELQKIHFVLFLQSLTLGFCYCFSLEVPPDFKVHGCIYFMHVDKDYQMPKKTSLGTITFYFELR